MMKVIEFITFVPGDGQCLHKCCGVRHAQHRKTQKHVFLNRGCKTCDDSTDDTIANGVVKAKVKMSRKEHGDGHPVQIITGHGVVRVQYGIKIMGVPVIAYKPKDAHPNIGAQGKSFQCGRLVV